MAKGVKKIKLTGGYSAVQGDASEQGVRLIVQPLKRIMLQVSEWETGTTEAAKAKGLTWIWQNSERGVLRVEPGYGAVTPYTFQMPKRYCGSFTYYIEASLSGKPDPRPTGLYISGTCTPAVVSSKWSSENDGKDRRKTAFSYGENVFLNLETEGINGNWVTIEVYQLDDSVSMQKISDRVFGSHYDPTADDKATIKYFDKGWIINGELNLQFYLSPAWRTGKDMDKYYIKLINSDGAYVKDAKGNQIHANYLRINNAVVDNPAPVEIPVNNAPILIGQADINNTITHTCKFTIIEITDKGTPYEVFNEGKFNRLRQTGGFYTVDRIYYDYDKWNIRADAKTVLAKISRLLTEDLPFVPVELGSHTDCRGTAEYNQALSQKRAQSVVDYLISRGVNPKRIFAKGYGESRPINSGENISEELHQQNRRTTIRFLVSENDAQSILYDTIAGSAAKPEKFTLKISDLCRRGCYTNPKHNYELNTIDAFVRGQTHPLKDGTNSLVHEIYSVHPDIPAFLNGFFRGSANNFRFFLHSCAYYSPKDTPALIINAYPDAKFTFNFRYDYTEPYFLNNIPVPLVTGIKKIAEKLKEVTQFLEQLHILGEFDKDISDRVIDFIVEESNKYSLGVHMLYNFSDYPVRQHPSPPIDYTEKYRLATELVIVYFLLVEVVLMILIIYLTKGKGAFGRLRKYKRLFKMLKKLDDAGFDFVYPKVAVNRGAYFEQAEGRIARVFEENVSAKPLIGIQLEKTYSLNNLPEKYEGVGKILDRYGNGASFSFKLEGTIQAEYNLKFNMQSRKAEIKDKLFPSFSNSSGKFTGGVAIKAFAKLQASLNITIDTSWIPFVRTSDVNIKGTLDAELGGYVVFSRQYGIDKTGIWYQDNLYFSGIKGTVMQKLEASTEKGKIYDSNSENKSIPFTLFKGKNILMDKIQLLRI